MTKISEIEGIGVAYAETLAGIGIETVEELLQAGGAKAGREDLAAKSGISETLILEWVNRADLMRIKGIGSEFSDLLEAAGVDSVPELAQRNPANLHAAMAAHNEARSLVRRTPTVAEVEGWVAEARASDKIVTH